MAIASVKEMVEVAKSEIDNISPEEASRRATEEGALIVDIRDVREMQRDGAIPGAMHAPRGMLEFWVSPDSPYTKEIFGEEASSQLNIIECAEDGKNNQSELCKAKGINLFPSWEINGRIESGVKSLAELAEWSNYKGPKDF